MEICMETQIEATELLEYLSISPKLGLYSREGNGTPLQYSCLENPMDGETW